MAMEGTFKITCDFEGCGKEKQDWVSFWWMSVRGGFNCLEVLKFDAEQYQCYLKFKDPPPLIACSIKHATGIIQKRLRDRECGKLDW